MADVQYSHDDFEVVRTDPRFGGFEVLKHKDERTVRPTLVRCQLRFESHMHISHSILNSCASR